MFDRDNPTSHSYFSQRLRLHYLDWGNDDGADMLLIHGVHDHCHSWDWLAQSLRDRFHVVAPDLRGHGDSEWTLGSPYSYLEYVQDIAQLVQQRHLAPLTLVSHSLGGTIASIFAGTYPEFVSRLVIIEGVGLYPAGHSSPRMIVCGNGSTPTIRFRPARRGVIRRSRTPTNACRTPTPIFRRIRRVI